VGLLDRLAPRRSEPDVRAVAASAAPVADPVFVTKALKKFLACLTAREQPVLLDLGPVVGSNVSFFGEQLGCKIFVEDIFADLDRHVRDGKLEALPALLQKRLPQTTGSVDGILCWDVIDYLDRQAAQALATELTRVLRPDGALLGFFGTAQPREPRYTKFIIVDEVNLKHRPYPAARGRQAILLNRDIIRLFSGLRVAESFLLKNNLREILFRKPV
jgi:methyltransferase family protein